MRIQGICQSLSFMAPCRELGGRDPNFRPTGRSPFSKAKNPTDSVCPNKETNDTSDPGEKPQHPCEITVGILNDLGVTNPF